MENEESYKSAVQYDRVITWEPRLNRELPLLFEVFNNAEQLLDVACASGRHAIAMAKQGFHVFAFDISPGFIQLAKEIAKQETNHLNRNETENTDTNNPDQNNKYHSIENEYDNSIENEYDAEKQKTYNNPEFFVADATSNLYSKLGELKLPSYYDGAYMLGNAIANMGDQNAGKKMINNMYLLLKPGGIFFAQTVNYPTNAQYSPLKRVGDNVAQRVLIPASGNGYNIEFHMNIIDTKELKYVKNGPQAYFFMYSFNEFKSILENTGFKVIKNYGAYDKSPVDPSPGKTVLWVIKKPEIQIPPSGIRLFQHFGINKNGIIRRTLSIWQNLMVHYNYNFIRYYLFLYPRVLSYHKYKSINFNDKTVVDLGCAMGTDLRQIQIDSSPRKLIGVEKEELLIESGKFLFADVAPDIEFIVSDVFNFEYENVDIFLVGSLLHFLNEDKERELLSKIFTMLNPNGILLARNVGKRGDNLDMEYFQNLHTINETIELLQKIGFTNIDVVELNHDDVPKGERSYGDHAVFSIYAQKK